MVEARRLLDRAARCREIARDYRADVGAPLIDLAKQLEQEAQDLHPGSSEVEEMIQYRAWF